MTNPHTNAGPNAGPNTGPNTGPIDGRPMVRTHSSIRTRKVPPIVAQADLATPLGTMTAMATAQGLAALWFDARERHPEAARSAPEDPTHPHIAAARRWLEVYWGGGDPGALAVPLDLHGTPFQRAVWQELLRIPRGHTRTYGEVARRVGGGAVPRATGTACGANPVGVIVPCHRVLGANGSLTGFAAGLPRKQQLLVHEGALLT